VRPALGALVACLALWGKPAAAEIDKAKLGEARSLVAEAAAVEQFSARGRITQIYADGLQGDIRKSLDKLKKEPAFAEVAERALAALERHDAAGLTALRDHLAAQEKAHGRAD
jgi:hypothetical protein